MPQTLLRFVHLSDTHYTDPAYEPDTALHHPRQTTHWLVEEIKQLPFQPDLILHTGDVLNRPQPHLYEPIKALFAEIDTPTTYVVGNHDDSDALQRVLLERETVQTPLWREEIFGDVRFLFLDANHPDVDPPAGRFDTEQLEWLEHQVSTDDPRPIVVALHHPVLKTHTSAWYDDFMNTENGEKVHKILAPASDRVRGVFSGHIHHNLTFMQDGILYSSVRSSWTQFDIVPHQGLETRHDPNADPGYNVVTITDVGTYVQQYTYRVDSQNS